MRKPDFFTVGAPKCGTSALYTYLKEHPDVFLSDVKISPEIRQHLRQEFQVEIERLSELLGYDLTYWVQQS